MGPHRAGSRGTGGAQESKGESPTTATAPPAHLTSVHCALRLPSGAGEMGNCTCCYETHKKHRLGLHGSARPLPYSGSLALYWSWKQGQCIWCKGSLLKVEINKTLTWKGLISHLFTTLFEMDQNQCSKNQVLLLYF